MRVVSVSAAMSRLPRGFPQKKHVGDHALRPRVPLSVSGAHVRLIIARNADDLFLRRATAVKRAGLCAVVERGFAMRGLA